MSSVLIDAGTNPTIPVAVDVVAGEDMQVLKINAGTAGASVPIVAGQQLAAASLPVVLASDAALPAGTNAIGKLSSNTGVTIGAVEIAASQTLATLTGGGVAHDGVDSGNPVKIGGQARTTNPTAVSDADRSNFITDKLGKQVVVGSIRDLKTTQQTTITSSTSETTVLTAVASTFLDIYGVIVTNTSATATKVTFKDATAGTTRFVIQVPATETRGFMLPESAAHNQASVNNNWTATAGTSVASLEITIMAVKNI